MNDRRRKPRAAKRLGCEIRSGNRRHFGMVLNVSSDGLFVQTQARIEAGAPLQLTLGSTADRLHLTVRGRVARVVRAPQALASVVRGGVGIRLEDPPAAYLSFVASLRGTRGAGGELPAPQPLELDGSFSFRVELGALAGSEARTLLVSCKTEAEARELAEAELDEGWKILSVAPL